MDYEELGRNCQYIGEIDPVTLPTEEEEQVLNQEALLNDELIVLDNMKKQLIAQEESKASSVISAAATPQSMFHSNIVSLKPKSVVTSNDPFQENSSVSQP